MSFTSIKSGLIKLFFALLLSSQLHAQIQQLERYEFPLLDTNPTENPSITALGKDGVLMYRRILARTADRIDITKLDTALNENWRGQINIEKSLRVVMVKSKQSLVYFILRSAIYGDFNFTVIVLDAQTGQFLTYYIKNIIPFSVSEFVATDRAMLLGGYFNYRPVVIYFNQQTGRSQLLPGFFNEPGELTQLAARESGEIDIIVSSKNYQRKKVLWVRNYSAEGNLINTTVLEPEGNKNMIYAKSVFTPEGKQLVVGVYGTQHPEFGRGLFFAAINIDNQYQIQYHPYGEFENFFNFMKPGREKRLKERIARRNEKGKKNRQAYRFLIHQIIPYKNQFLVLGESFYPRYIYSNPYGYYGVGMAGSIVRGDRIFDGYRYTHSMIASFSENGKLNWDNSFVINDIKTFTLEQFVKVILNGKEIDMVYLFENTLRTKTINTNQVVAEKKKEPLKMKSENDFVKENKTEKSLLDYWFDDYLIAYGIQTVSTSKYGPGGGDRKVFFINKLKYP